MIVVVVHKISDKCIQKMNPILTVYYAVGHNSNFLTCVYHWKGLTQLKRLGHKTQCDDTAYYFNSSWYYHNLSTYSIHVHTANHLLFGHLRTETGQITCYVWKVFNHTVL